MEEGEQEHERRVGTGRLGKEGQTGRGDPLPVAFAVYRRILPVDLSKTASTSLPASGIETTALLSPMLVTRASDAAFRDRKNGGLIHFDAA